jgi:hypothetical protein
MIFDHMAYDEYTSTSNMSMVDLAFTQGKFRPLKRHAPPKGIKAAVKRRRKIAKASRQKNRGR